MISHMSCHTLDDIDLRILAVLQQDARTSNLNLSLAANLSPPPTLRRKQTLEKKGFIRGYHAVLDSEKLGFGVLGFVFVGLNSQAECHLKAFQAQVHLWPLVRECYVLNGDTDFLLKCVAHDLSELQSFVTTAISTMDRVAAVKTSFVIEVSKDEPTVPLSQVTAPPRPVAARKLRLPTLPCEAVRRRHR